MIIVSRNAINQNSNVVICVPVTDLANCGRIYPSQVTLKKGTGGLTKDSVVLCEQIRAITVNRLVSQLGTLDRQSLGTVDDRLRITLDLG